MTTICHFPFWFQWKHLSRLPKLWNFHLVDSKCFQIKFITNKFFFTGRCHFQLSNIRITKRFWLAGDDDYLRGATSINHQVALRANFKIYSRSAKGGEKGDPNRNPWLAKMGWMLLWGFLSYVKCVINLFLVGSVFLIISVFCAAFVLFIFALCLVSSAVLSSPPVLSWGFRVVHFVHVVCLRSKLRVRISA